MAVFLTIPWNGSVSLPNNTKNNQLSSFSIHGQGQQWIIMPLIIVLGTGKNTVKKSRVIVIKIVMNEKKLKNKKKYDLKINILRDKKRI